MFSQDNWHVFRLSRSKQTSSAILLCCLSFSGNTKPASIASSTRNSSKADDDGLECATGDVGLEAALRHWTFYKFTIQFTI